MIMTKMLIMIILVSIEITIICPDCSLNLLATMFFFIAFSCKVNTTFTCV